VVAQAYLLVFTVLQMWSDMSAASIALAKALILRRFCREDRSFQLVFEGSFECELANDQNLFERLEDAIKRVSVHSACICRISRGSYAVNLWCSNQCVPIKPFVIIIDARASTWLWMTCLFLLKILKRSPLFPVPISNTEWKWGWALQNGVGPCICRKRLRIAFYKISVFVWLKDLWKWKVIF
jgi:hypothetical protein